MTTEQLNAEQMRAAAVAAHLADDNADTAALVWADALEESGDTARAEFVRVQAEAAGMSCTGYGNWPSGAVGKCGCPRCCLVRRERELLHQNETDWRQSGACLKCDGTGDARKVSLSHNFVRCSECSGTGSGGGLLKWLNYESPTEASHERVRVQWRRGLPDAVEVQSLAEVLDSEPIDDCDYCGGNGSIPMHDASSAPNYEECDKCEGQGRIGGSWRPTPWALTVTRSHPSVTRFVVRNREPSPESVRVRQGRFWYRHGNSHGPLSEMLLHHVPAVVFDQLEGGEPSEVLGSHTMTYPTDEAANDALARAVMRVVRASQCS